MTGQQAITSIDRLLSQAHQRKLNDLESKIVLQVWDGNTYKSIAEQLLYELDYIKQVAARLWKVISNILGENICKNNIQSVLERYRESLPILGEEESIEIDRANNINTNLRSLETWKIADRLTTISFLSYSLVTKQSESLPQDRQHDRLGCIEVQNEIQSALWQDLDVPIEPNILIDKILNILIRDEAADRSINCLVINYYHQNSVLSDRSISI